MIPEKQQKAVGKETGETAHALDVQRSFSSSSGRRAMLGEQVSEMLSMNEQRSADQAVTSEVGDAAVPT